MDLSKGLEGENSQLRYLLSFLLILSRLIPLYFPKAMIISSLFILNNPLELGTGSKSSSPGPNIFPPFIPIRESSKSSIVPLKKRGYSFIIFHNSIKVAPASASALCAFSRFIP